jgi:hypothetical protein
MTVPDLESRLADLVRAVEQAGPPPDVAALERRRTDTAFPRARVVRPRWTIPVLGLGLVAAVVAAVVAWPGPRPADVVAGSPTPATSPGRGVPLEAVDWAAVSYPMDCAGVGTETMDVVFARPSAGVEIAAVLVACRAGAGSPPRTVFVYDRAASAVEPHLLQTLWSDGVLRLLGAVSVDGDVLTATGSSYSSRDVARCCPDGTFTASWSWDGENYVEVSSDAPPYEQW